MFFNELTDSLSKAFNIDISLSYSEHHKRTRRILHSFQSLKTKKLVWQITMKSITDLILTGNPDSFQNSSIIGTDKSDTNFFLFNRRILHLTAESLN